MRINIGKFLALLLLNIGFLYAQEAPEGFEYNQSRFQAFNLYLSGDIGGASLEEGDWIAAFNDDVCVGSAPWTGEYTSLPIMGNDNSQWTVGYLDYGEIPTFQVYDVSANTFYQAQSSEMYPFENLGTWIINAISVVDDWTSSREDSVTFISGVPGSRIGNTLCLFTFNFDVSFEVNLVWSSSVASAGMLLCGGFICVGTSCCLI